MSEIYASWWFYVVIISCLLVFFKIFFWTWFWNKRMLQIEASREAAREGALWLQNQRTSQMEASREAARERAHWLRNQRMNRMEAIRERAYSQASQPTVVVISGNSVAEAPTAAWTQGTTAHCPIKGTVQRDGSGRK
jgi:hypothetical protein